MAAATATASQALGGKVYGILYADPPWKFEVHAESGMDRCADGHYPCMPTESIAALQIPAADDAVLFLWSTPPMQPHALAVMAAWGFTYKSLIVWDKGRDGTGYWVRGRVEILLIGSRGNVPAPLPGEQPPQLIAAPCGRHSEKPAVFAEMIERLYPSTPSTPKIGLFARKARRGSGVYCDPPRRSAGIGYRTRASPDPDRSGTTGHRAEQLERPTPGQGHQDPHQPNTSSH